MYVWFVNYGYSVLILLVFAILLLYSAYLGKNKSKKTKVFYAVATFIVFCIIVSIIYIFRSYQIGYIEKKCFDYPVLI